MAGPLWLSSTAARQLMVAAQGLDRPPAAAASKAAVLQAIQRMGALQIDTISVVARSPYLVLWSRLGAYEQRWLDDLLAEGALFEYWAHEACFLPIEDYALYRHRMLDPTSMGWRYAHEWVAAHPQEVQRVLAAIREHGPVRSADLTRTDGKAGGWWEWKPEKLALEALFTAGELMIARRERFQRVYDLRQRVLPAWDDAQLPPTAEVYRTLALKTVRALGVAGERWVPDYFRFRGKDRSEALSQVLAGLAREGELWPIQVEGLAGPAYLHPAHLELAEAAAVGALGPELTTLLSPFDPLVWDRNRTKAVFGFDYTLECYVPAAKRRYGYYALPILHHGALVGRLDAKAHRKEGHLEVKAVYLEPDVAISDGLVAGLAMALRGCAGWLGVPEVTVRCSHPDELAPILQAQLG